MLMPPLLTEVISYHAFVGMTNAHTELTCELARLRIWNSFHLILKLISIFEISSINLGDF